MLIEIFNATTREVSLTAADAAKLDHKGDNWFFAMLVAIGLRIIGLLKISPITPIITTFNVTDAVTVLRDSPNGARVRIYNEGPGSIWLTFGETSPVAPDGAPPAVATNIIPAFMAVDSPAPVIGKIRARTWTGENAAVTLTVFCS